MSGLADLIQDMGVLASGFTGSTGTISRTVPGTYDPSTGSSTGTTTTCPCYIKETDASSLVSLGFKFGQDLVRAGDLAFAIPNKGLTFIPGAGDSITTTLDGVSSTFAIVDVKPEYFQGVATEYGVLVRR